MNVVMVSSEVAPFSKSGGLGDAVASLAKALARAGHRVCTVSPRYRGAAVDAAFTGFVARVPLGAWEHRAGIHLVEADGVRHFLVDNGMYDRDGYYGDASGSFGDNHIRFALLSQAAMHVARRFVGDDVVFHCHDWQAALLPAYLKAYWRPLGLFERCGSVLTLHNPAHQGRLPPSLFLDLELPARWFTPWGLEFHGDLGLLKGGILHADQLTTVSPTFARELVAPGGGFGLESLIASRALDLVGILNGIDLTEWDPATDPHLAARFHVDDLAGKAALKALVQAEFELPVDPAAPLVVSVGRLDPQKGVDLLLDSVPWLVSEGAQVVVLGSAHAAHKAFEHRLQDYAHRYPRQVRAWIGYDEARSHRLIGAADLFAMPSVFEPCGLTQMYAQRYGAVPVVRRTGGLADTVDECDAWADTGTGFLFERPAPTAFRDSLWRALNLFRTDPEAFAALRRRGMRRDFSWDRSIPAWQLVYERAQAVRAP
jgi:starch synthase